MPKWLQYYIGGGSLGTPKSDYVICARPHTILAVVTKPCWGNNAAPRGSVDWSIMFEKVVDHLLCHFKKVHNPYSTRKNFFSWFLLWLRQGMVLAYCVLATWWKLSNFNPRRSLWCDNHRQRSPLIQVYGRDLPKSAVCRFKPHLAPTSFALSSHTP